MKTSLFWGNYEPLWSTNKAFELFFSLALRFWYMMRVSTLPLTILFGFVRAQFLKWGIFKQEVERARLGCQSDLDHDFSGVSKICLNNVHPKTWEKHFVKMGTNLPTGSRGCIYFFANALIETTRCKSRLDRSFKHQLREIDAMTLYVKGWYCWWKKSCTTWDV